MRFSSWLERRVVLSLSDEESWVSSGWEVNLFSWVSYMASNSSWAALGMLQDMSLGSERDLLRVQLLLSEIRERSGGLSLKICCWSDGTAVMLLEQIQRVTIESVGWGSDPEGAFQLNGQ